LRVVVVGGSGRVGTGVLPYLASWHEVVNFDIRPPSVPAGRYVRGSLFDTELLGRVLTQADGVIFMALGVWPPEVDASYEINVRGVHYVLEAARQAGLMHVVHSSTASVHDESKGSFPDEEMPLEPLHVYGLTKGLGETVCRWFCRMYGMSVLALRLFAPQPYENWLAQCRTRMPNGWTTFLDTARAYDAALRATSHSGFDAVFISGDWTGTYVNCAKAKRVLGWEPLDRYEGEKQNS